MTLEEMATAIRNHVSDGLKGVSEFSYSIDQLKEEIVNMRGDIVKQYKNQGMPINMKFLLQSIDGIPVKPIDVSHNCVWSSDEKVPGFEIPKIATTSLDKAIEYLGGMSKRDCIITYYETDEVENHNYRPYTKRKPYAWVDTTPNENGNYYVYLFNQGTTQQLKQVSIRAVFEDPKEVEIFKGRPDLDDSFEFPAPRWMKSQIIDQLTMKYVEYYRRMNIGYMYPNDQTRNL